MDCLFSEKRLTPPTLAILLCTYNGQRFLAEQLASFEYQTHTCWELWVSDDGSDDGTQDILHAFKNKFPNNKISIIKGPSEGFVSNFLSLVCNKNINADYYAYADQDDVWKADKIERAFQFLKSLPNGRPGLYCSRTELINESGNHIGYSPLFEKPPSFQNALIQNIGGANTMVFNQAARDILLLAGNQISVVSHDWWTYQLVSGLGGFVHYDSQPSILYRQHNKNIVGMNNSWVARFKRIHMLFQGRFREWNDRHITELSKLKKILTIDNQATLERFSQVRQNQVFKRLYQLRKSGVYRQTLFGNIGLIVAAVLKKL